MLSIRSIPSHAARGAPAARFQGAIAPSLGARHACSAASAPTATALLRATEAHLGQATAGLWELAHLGRRGEQAEGLARLADALAPSEQQLARQALATPMDAADPQTPPLRRQLAAARQIQVLARAGATFLGAYAASQGPQEAPVLAPAWTRRLCSEAQALLLGLAASERPQDRALAARVVASAPEAVHPLLSLDKLPSDILRDTRQVASGRNAGALSLPQWLALRLLAHPDSGAAAALQAQERLQDLSLDASEAAAPLLRHLARLQLTAVASAARLPGLGLADPLARYHLALSAQAHPPLEETLREGGEWLIRRALCTRRDVQQARSEIGLGDPAHDRLLCLQSGDAQAGPVRGLRLDPFHPPGALARDAALLMPGQIFRVCESGEELLRLADGQPLRVRRYELRKQGEESRTPMPGTLAPRVDAGLRAWELASVL